MSSSASPNRLDVLDGLRGLAILLVVWYHAWLVSGQTVAGVNFVAESGFIGVDLFFFISGFCLFFPYARAAHEGRNGPTVRRFFIRRAVKILPSYFIALAVFAGVYHARFASPGEAFVQIVSHLTFLHPLSPLTFGAISGPLWTIGIEVQFYLLFPLVCPLFRKAPLKMYVALVTLSETYRYAIGHAGLGTSFLFINQLPAYLDVFAAGMLAALGFVRLQGYVKAEARPVATAASVAAFILAGAGLVHISAVGRIDVNAAYDWLNASRVAVGPLCAVLALSTSFAFTQWRSVVATRVLVFLSVISYNLYLWNLEIVVWYHQTGLGPLPTFGLSILTAVLLSTAITYVIERPILEADMSRLYDRIFDRLGRRNTDSTIDARTAS